MNRRTGQTPQKRRAKVRLEFPEKLFYERCLAEWKEQVGDTNVAENRNRSYVLRKALANLKLFPLDVNGWNPTIYRALNITNFYSFAELRKIRGIGVDIATRLAASWTYAIDAKFGGQQPTVVQVKALQKNEPFTILENSAAVDGAHLPFVPRQRQTAAAKRNAAAKKAIPSSNGGEQNAVAGTSAAATVPTIELSDDEEEENNENSQPPKRPRTGSARSIAGDQPNLNAENNADFFDDYLLDGSHSQPAFSFEFQDHDPVLNVATTSSSSLTADTTATKTAKQKQPIPSQQMAVLSDHKSSSSAPKSDAPSALSHSPEQFARSTLLLITDNREHIGRGGGGRKGAKGLADHLLALNVQFDSRALSVGDFLWLLQWNDEIAGGKREMVLDYVVERKTWDDLKRSIRETRYLEQKQRLACCGLRNVVLVVEGNACPDRALEQAMVSSAVESGFLVHRTANVQGTAKFLQQITQRLTDRCLRDKLCGPSFASLQEESKKSHATTVADCWLRQLTVCPGMSIDRAQLIRQRFPSLRALTEFYRDSRNGLTADDEKLLSKEIAQLPISISKQMHIFLRKALAN